MPRYFTKKEICEHLSIKQATLELDDRVANGEVIKLTKGYYKLPNRLDANDSAKKTEKKIFLIAASHVSVLSNCIALFWAEENNIVNIARVRQFKTLVEHTIFDCLYRDELKLHCTVSGRIIEYNKDLHFREDFALYWHEIQFVLNKQGIDTPEDNEYLFDESSMDITYCFSGAAMYSSRYIDINLGVKNDR